MSDRLEKASDGVDAVVQHVVGGVGDDRDSGVAETRRVTTLQRLADPVVAGASEEQHRTRVRLAGADCVGERLAGERPPRDPPPAPRRRVVGPTGTVIGVVGVVQERRQDALADEEVGRGVVIRPVHEPCLEARPERETGVGEA